MDYFRVALENIEFEWEMRVDICKALQLPGCDDGQSLDLSNLLGR